VLSRRLTVRFTYSGGSVPANTMRRDGEREELDALAVSARPFEEQGKRGGGGRIAQDGKLENDNPGWLSGARLGLQPGANGSCQISLYAASEGGGLRTSCAPCRISASPPLPRPLTESEVP